MSISFRPGQTGDGMAGARGGGAGSPMPGAPLSPRLAGAGRADSTPAAPDEPPVPGGAGVAVVGGVGVVKGVAG
eukprot:1608316-Alexandrium_andersonii.AAC.1